MESIIMVENEMRLKLELENLVVLCGPEKATYPLKDIACIILDNMNSSISGRLLAKLGELNVTLIATDKKHLPIGLYFPYQSFSRSSKILLSQIDFIQNRNNIWGDIIRAKIINQSKTLELLCFDNIVINNMKKYAEEVLGDDRLYKESFAAKVYFNELMGTTFSRGNDDILLNSALNYAYAVIRSNIAKIGIGCGLNMQLGIHHKNEYNEYNLADDLIEPYRPIVDLYAYKLMKDQEFFTQSHRKDLINILYKNIYYGGRNVTIMQSIEEYVKSFAKLVKTDENKMEYPDVANVEFAKNDYEFIHYVDDYIFEKEEEDEV